MKNSTSRVLNKPALPLPKFSSNSQKFTTGRYFSSLKPPSGSSSSHQVLEGKRDVNVTRPIQSKISEDVGFSGERVDPKRGFDSQHKWENTFEHTKHISFSVSSALANSSEDRASKKKYPVSPMAENLLKKSFKQPFMNCLDEEDSDEEVASQSRADSILSSKVTQKNPNETFNASKVSNCTYVAPKVSTIVAPSPLSKVSFTSLLTFRQDTRLPPGYFPPSEIVKNDLGKITLLFAAFCVLYHICYFFPILKWDFFQKPYILVAERSKFLLFPNVQKTKVFR